MRLAEPERERLKAVIAHTLNLKKETVDLGKSRTHYPMWDSLKHLELMMAIESEFGIRFTSTQLTQATEPIQIEKLVKNCLTDQ